MRLLNTKTIQLEEFRSLPRPKYAILSHTWGEDEVTFRDLNFGRTDKGGYTKIRETCRLACEDNLDYAWIDTCCIDKTNSTEVSEEINSMFHYYQDAQVCYAYLEDVDPLSSLASELHSQNGPSRWFERGWTLQELLAPAYLVFLASDWSVIGTRAEFSHNVNLITNIGGDYLVQSPQNYDIRSLLERASVAERMSWASRRTTTRTEDRAYCLLGIFGINMPLLYGEGKNAFRRLQEEIARRSDDQSLFAWNDPSNNWDSILADSPESFAGSSDIVAHRTGSLATCFSITNKGVVITLPVLSLAFSTHILLECGPRNDPASLVVIELWQIHNDMYQRAPRSSHFSGLVNHNAWHQWEKKTICLLNQTYPYTQLTELPHGCRTESFTLPYSISLPSAVTIENHPAEWKNFRGRHSQPGLGIVPKYLERMVGMRPNRVPHFILLSAVMGGWLSRLFVVLATFSEMDIQREEEGVQHVEYLLNVQNLSLSTPVLLTLTKRKPLNNRMRCQLSLSFVHDQPNSESPSRFLRLPDGRILCARSHLQRIFGQLVVGVDVFYHSSWLNLKFAQFIDAVQDVLPSRPDYNGYRFPALVYASVTYPLFFALSRLLRSDIFTSELVLTAYYINRVLLLDLRRDLSDGFIALVLLWKIHIYWVLTDEINAWVWSLMTYKPRYKDRDNDTSEDRYRLQMVLLQFVTWITAHHFTAGAAVDCFLWGSVCIIICNICRAIMYHI